MNLGDIGKIRAAARHLLALIDDILDVSKIEAGKMELYAESFELRELLDEIVATIQPLVDRNHNALKIELASELGSLHTDRTKLKQVALNLLSNACKFTHEGEVRLMVRRIRATGTEWLLLEVQDSGIGIASERLEELFQPFRQADESTTRKYGGTGLGLSISRHYCQMMHGSIQARSAPGNGSTFTVRIPVDLATPPRARPQPAPSETL